MTKEAILDKCYSKTYDSQDGYSQVTALKAMDEYAKQEAIGFIEWASDEGYTNYDGNDRWISPMQSRTVYTTKELYNLYQESKAK